MAQTAITASTTSTPTGAVESAGVDIGMSKGVVPTRAKCNLGCGVGIGAGCLGAIIIAVIAFIAVRRQRRKVRTIEMHDKWVAQKQLPDKPIPAPPPPVKSASGMHQV
ncbi:hypothetical protein EC988_006212 [Linderina pennispora]|nr:hypothetical protein EC988_006212 [Linderina pennispora]